MGSLFQAAVDALLALVKEMPGSNYDDELSLIQFRLRQLEPYVVAQYQFDEERIEGDIKDYTALLEAYRNNVGDKIDFLIDLGETGDSWDSSISMHLQEVLTDIIDTSRRIVN